MALASFWRRGKRFSMVWMSARMSSVLIISISRFGSMLVLSWRKMSGSSKALTTWTMAEHWRILARNLLPKPSPLEAPATRPAMSTNSTVAGMIFWLP